MLGVDVMGREESRLRAPESLARPPVALPGRGDKLPPSRSTVVFAEAFLDITGRIELLSGVPEELPSFRGNGESLRTDAEDGVRGFAAAESDPGMGDGAAELLAAAVAMRTCRRTCEACCSLRYATCWRRKSMGTLKRSALRRVS